MNAVPMKGRLKGKKIIGYIWAGPGSSWTKKENYFQLEDNKIVSACYAGPSGAFTLRFNGGPCVITKRHKNSRKLGRTAITLPGGKKKTGSSALMPVTAT